MKMTRCTCYVRILVGRNSIKRAHASVSVLPRHSATRCRRIGDLLFGKVCSRVDSGVG